MQGTAIYMYGVVKILKILLNWESQSRMGYVKLKQVVILNFVVMSTKISRS